MKDWLISRLRAFSLSPGWGLVLALCVGLLTAWARASADSDFFMPDPFSALTLWCVVVFVLSGWVPNGVVRANLRLILGVIPVVGVMGMEMRMAWSDGEDWQSSLMLSDDVLLRYHYRPHSTRHNGSETMNSRGLADDEYAVPKPPGVYRVVVLGDSVPNDVRIPPSERFYRVLRRILRAQRSDMEIEVINVSCEGYNTFQEVRLLEKVGLDYEPDLVVLAYVLNDPFAQNGAYRRMGNSYFAFRAVQLAGLVLHGSSCPLFAKMNEGYNYEMVVGASLERLRLLSELHGFPVVVAALPIAEEFSDADCMRAYDAVGERSLAQGFEFVRVVDVFEGHDYRDYLQPEDRLDVTHPNAAAHELMGQAIAARVLPLLPAAAPARGVSEQGVDERPGAGGGDDAEKGE